MATPPVLPPKAGPVLPKADNRAAILAWIDEVVASASPAAEMHLSTHLRNSVDALLEKLKG